MAFHDREQLTRREFLLGQRMSTTPRFREARRERSPYEFWHPHEQGRDFARSDEQYYYRNTINGRNEFSANSKLHQGKGPRSYQRRDERILEDINDRLYENPYLDASDIEVAVHNGEVTLSGVVDDRRSKRLAEDIGEAVAGVKNVENRLRVKRSA